MKEKLLYSWKTEEFEQHEKVPAWYVNMAVVFLAIAAFFVLVAHQYLAAVVVVLSLIALYVHASHEPKKIDCQITNRKVKIGNRNYSYQRLKSFWILDQSSTPKLYLQTTALLFSIISIPLGQGETDKIKGSLKNLLPEFVRGEMISDRITRWLRF